MKYSLFLIEESEGYFRQYESIYSFCLELSRMAGVDGVTGQSNNLDLLVPFKFAGPSLFDVAQLEEWFDRNGRGPNFKRLKKPVNRVWWDVDKDVQKKWRVKAEDELFEIVGNVIRRK